MRHPKIPMLVSGSCVFAILTGLVVLTGWALDLSTFKSMVPGFVAMNPLTAIAFAVAGVALWILRTPGQNRLQRRLAITGALAVVALGATKLIAYLGGVDLEIDRVLFTTSLGSNRIAPNTAICFLLLGCSLATMDFRTRRGFWPAPAFALSVATISLVSLVGYGYGADSLFRIASHIPMALNTGAVFHVLSIGVLLSRPDRGVISVLFNEGPGGLMARRLLPAAVIIPCGLGWLRIAGQRAGLYDTEFGAALMVAATVVLLLVVIGWIATALNRSDAERRKAEEAIRGLNEQLENRVAERTSELAAANHDLMQKNAENEMFVYSVSHDLRSPLVNLQGFSKELSAVSQDIRTILASAELPPAVSERGLRLVDIDMQRSIHFIQTAVMRLSNIIDALLRLSRAGRVEYQMQSVDVERVVSRVVESMSSTLFDRGATIRVHDLPTAWGDPTGIEQVFANLIGNALKYLDPQRPGVIEIGCVETGSAARGQTAREQIYFVRDNGLGIPESFLAKAFQAFKRFHVDVAEGDGMGLAIVRRIVDRHGGKVSVESTVGVGTTFFVTLPAQTNSVRLGKQENPRQERMQADGKRATDHCVSGRR